MLDSLVVFQNRITLTFLGKEAILSYRFHMLNI